MTYNNGFMYPQYYPQANYMQQPLSQGMNNGGQQTTTPQMQNGGFVLVPSEDVAINYPVAHGNCITFKIEGKPIVIEKSMGFSQLESPRLERYRLVKEEAPVQEVTPHDNKSGLDELQDKINNLESQIESMKSDMNVLREQIKKPTANKRKDNGGDRHDEQSE